MRRKRSRKRRAVPNDAPTNAQPNDAPTNAPTNAPFAPLIPTDALTSALLIPASGGLSGAAEASSSHVDDSGSVKGGIKGGDYVSRQSSARVDVDVDVDASASVVAGTEQTGRELISQPVEAHALEVVGECTVALAFGLEDDASTATAEPAAAPTHTPVPSSSTGSFVPPVVPPLVLPTSDRVSDRVRPSGMTKDKREKGHVDSRGVQAAASETAEESLKKHIGVTDSLALTNESELLALTNESELLEAYEQGQRLVSDYFRVNHLTTDSLYLSPLTHYTSSSWFAHLNYFFASHSLLFFLYFNNKKTKKIMQMHKTNMKTGKSNLIFFPTTAVTDAVQAKAFNYGAAGA